LENLLTLQGADVAGLLERAAGFCLNRRMESAQRNLRELTAQLDAYGILERVTLDLAEYRNLEYYTGMTFEFLLPDSAAVAGSGGRYDGLIGRFGRSRPAVGGILHLDRLVRAVHSNQAPQALSPKPPLCLVGQTKSGVALESMGRLRQQGLDIVVHTDPLSESGILAMGHDLGARVVANWCDRTQSFHVLACTLPEHVGPMDVSMFEQLLAGLQRTELSVPDQSTAIMAGSDV
jgi:ATP phosphoribosyltransferase regulatory subunit